MAEKKFYQHYKGGEYFVDCIAKPVTDEVKKEGILLGKVTYHEGGLMDLYYLKGVTYIDSKEEFVIYQSEGQYNTNRAYAREVDDFFSTVKVGGKEVERFKLKEKQG